jgi:rhamnulokinase
VGEDGLHREGILHGVIFPDDPRFFNPTDMVAAIQGYLNETGQRSIARFCNDARIVHESLALRYATVIRKLDEITGKSIRGVRIVGRSQNEFLNQATANATGLEVVAGPVEATAIGSAIVQAITNRRFTEAIYLRWADIMRHSATKRHQRWSGWLTGRWLACRWLTCRLTMVLCAARIPFSRLEFLGSGGGVC